MMQLLMYLSQMLIPLVIFGVLGYAGLQRRNSYEDFTEGAKEGLRIVMGILPTLIGLLTAVGVLRASGFLDMTAGGIGKLLGHLRVPSELVPLAIVKMFSSSAATGLLLDLYKKCGTDSYAGLAASIALSCTETIFYTMSVYFAAAKVTKTRWTLAGALLATGAGLCMAVVLAGLMQTG